MPFSHLDVGEQEGEKSQLPPQILHTHVPEQHWLSDVQLEPSGFPSTHVPSRHIPQFPQNEDVDHFHVPL